MNANRLASRAGAPFYCQWLAVKCRKAWTLTIIWAERCWCLAFPTCTPNPGYWKRVSTIYATNSRLEKTTFWRLTRWDTRRSAWAEQYAAKPTTALWFSPINDSPGRTNGPSCLNGFRPIWLTVCVICRLRKQCRWVSSQKCAFWFNLCNVADCQKMVETDGATVH